MIATIVFTIVSSIYAIISVLLVHDMEFFQQYLVLQCRQANATNVSVQLVQRYYR